MNRIEFRHRPDLAISFFCWERTKHLFAVTSCRVRFMKRTTERVAAQVRRFVLGSPIAHDLASWCVVLLLPPSHPIFGVLEEWALRVYE